MSGFTEPVLYMDKKGYFLQTDAAKTPIDLRAAESVKQGYDLIIDDSLIFYKHMHFPQNAGKDPSGFIENYLLTAFPADSVTSFGYYRKNDDLLIAVFRAGMLNDKAVKRILERAGRITSPLTERYAKEDSFVHSFGKTTIACDDGELTHVPSVNTPPFKVRSASASLRVKGMHKLDLGLSGFTVPAVLLLVCWVLFFAGSYFRYLDKKARLTAAEDMLTEVYRRAGVASAPDPYGMLMAKAGRNGKAQDMTVLKTMEQISRAQSQDITAVSLEIRNGTAVYDGVTKDFAYIEDMKSQLKKTTGKNIELTNTKKDDGSVSFTLRF